MLVKKAEVGFVRNEIGKRHIEIALLFVVRIIFFAVHREGEDAWVVFSHCGCAISLVHIKVDNENSRNIMMIDQMMSAHDDVVQNTKPFASLVKGVMGTSGDVHGTAVLQGEFCVVDGALADRSFPVDQLLR